MTTFNHLPDEVILRIFRYFTQKELQTCLRYVSTRWNNIAEDGCLYQEIIVDGNLNKQDAICLLQKHANDIKHLSFMEREDLNELAEYVKDCSNLQSIVIKLSYSPGDNILEVVKNCNNLRTIVIQYSSCIPNLPDLFQAVEKRPMKKINIRGEDITKNDLTCLHNIEDLRLKSVKVDTLSIYKFCQNNSAYLTTLKLITYQEYRDECSFDVNETIFAAIGECRNLRTLCLGHQVVSKMNDNGLSKLYKLNYLSTFVIHYAALITTEGFFNFFGQPLAKNLKKIGLCKCLSVSNKVFRSIANNCKNLEKFTYEQFKDKEKIIKTADIIMLINNCKSLQRLHLFGMDISIAEILHLIPSYLPNLKSLKYCNDDNPMKIPSFMHVLEQKLPDFSVSGLQWKFSLYVHCKRKE